MIYRYGITLRILLAAFFGLLVVGVSAENQVHTVMRGETLFSISRSYNVNLDDLMRQNNITDASKLQAGMKLTIPSVPSITANFTETVRPAAQVSYYSEYMVSQNETLYSIARSKGITLQALRETNGFSKNYMLKAGEKIKIPNPTTTAPAVRPPVRETPVKAAQKPDPAIRWPVAAKEMVYMNNNAGVRLSGVESESIKSLTKGTVVYANSWRGYGNVAVIESDRGYQYIYGVCETLSVKKGDTIEPGTELGKLGIYQRSGRPELVFMVSLNGSLIDPAKAPRS